MALTLRWRSSTTLPVDGSPLKPETFRERTSADAARVALRVGNATAEVGDLFEIEGDAADGALVVEGDLTHVCRLGRGMATGSLKVRGDVGPQLGAEMAGGLLDLDGSCGDWAGAEMAGGVLRIRGYAGNSLGAAYPGSRRGMREGLILVGGSAGDDVGLLMRRGAIGVKGAVGAGLGRNMIAGTIYACGAVGAMPGAGMKRGSLVLSGLGDDAERSLSPTFHFAVRLSVPILGVYASLFHGHGFVVPPSVSSAEVDRYNGDLAVGGQGEILVAVPQ
ncbi:MAG: formylmethanofuran dehydrogenase subunit C [Paludisphaera borealis]|uniref:formylmethanofuran dehydrogenase subunit C n=1 Tax=Paludisphaera borealis TaxID=1387353 RepID=UPI002850B2C9|nr:formylmethanofuran dehydrogenase subunit C [Paludisphaera borealis]MDR3621008.1 formylmethanofuran dehydrogenase subunit C [Paludisphaera borealis]